MNKIMLIGNLGQDPEMTYTPNGVAVTKFSLAVNEYKKDVDGKAQYDTSWFNCVAWRNTAETASAYLRKGHKVFVEGKLVVRKYTDKNGVERTAIEVSVSSLEMLTPKPQSAEEHDPELERHPF
jgi:single-strand DNA-binding protein